jgi:HEAT repeat protein
LTQGHHDVVVFVSPRTSTLVPVDPKASAAALAEQFERETAFWKQLEIGKQIVERRDATALASLAHLLTHEDRHIRGNTAFVFAALGDTRGFATIADILTDRSDRPKGQGVPISTVGRDHVALQIKADRYYAAHLFGDLRDPRAVPILVPLLKDPDVNAVVPWSLGQIGDSRAVAPLLDALDDDRPSQRVLVIYALETLKARDAIPRLTALLDDHRKSNLGAHVSVADAARTAIAKLKSSLPR